MDIIKRVNRKYKQNFTRDSKFYRWQQPHYFLDEKDGIFFVGGKEDSASSVEDIYHRPVREVWANSLKDPGLGVTYGYCQDFARYGPYNLEIMLNDVLDAGGKLYRREGTFDDAWYLTIPRGKKIPIGIHKGDVELAKLGVAYNRALNELGINTCIYLLDWPHDESEIPEAILCERINRKCGAPKYRLEYALEDLRPQRFEWLLKEDVVVKTGVDYAPTKLRVVQLKSKGKLEKRKVIACLMLNVLLRHPEIETLEVSREVKDYLEPLLKGVNLTRHHFLASNKS
jgi:hypothetical protein